MQLAGPESMGPGYDGSEGTSHQALTPSFVDHTYGCIHSTASSPEGVGASSCNCNPK